MPKKMTPKKSDQPELPLDNAAPSSAPAVPPAPAAEPNNESTVAPAVPVTAAAPVAAVEGPAVFTPGPRRGRRPAPWPPRRLEHAVGAIE
jgi:hypothetical protein